MINALSRIFTNIFQRFLPDAYIFALLLTLLVFTLGVGLTGHSPIQMIGFWGDGFWNLLQFSMQMVLILVTGHTLAKTQLIKSVLSQLAKLAHSSTSAILLSVFISSIACYINWGFGLIVSALFAIELAKKVENINFPLLIAAAYSGFLVWHGGLSGSIPLKLTDPSLGIQNIIGRDSIPLADTIYSPINLILSIGTVCILMFICFLLSKDTQNTVKYKIEIDDTKLDSVNHLTVASKLENSFSLNLIIVTMGVVYIGSELISGNGLTLNLMIFIFLILGMLFSSTPKQFLTSFNNSIKDSSGIILQFPFYAGIMGMMASSGLALAMSEFFISISDKNTFLLFTYWSAGIINFFVPSGGGQWAIQGPIIFPAAKELGIDFSKAAMAIAWGDAWSNMVQPFWALPILSIAKLRLSDMMGYSVILFIFSGIFSSIIFVIMS